MNTAQAELYELLQIREFDETDIDYFGNASLLKAFEIDSSELGNRFDATSHIPRLRSVIHSLKQCRYQLSTIGKVAEDVFQGPRFARVYVSEAHGKPFIQCSQFPLFRMYDRKYISQKVHQQDVLACVVKFGDVLITRSGTIGRVGFVSRAFSQWIASDDFVRVRCDPRRTDSGFIYAFMATAYGRIQATTQMFGGVVDHINESHISNVMVPDVSVVEQRRIGDIVREAFENRDRANELEDQAIAAVENLISASNN